MTTTDRQEQPKLTMAEVSAWEKWSIDSDVVAVPEYRRVIGDLARALLDSQITLDELERRLVAIGAAGTTPEHTREAVKAALITLRAALLDKGDEA